MNRLGRYSAIALSVAFLGLSGSAFAQAKLFFEGDMVVSPPEGSAAPHCVLSSQFKHQDRVVFRTRVLNQNGDPVTDKDLKSLVVILSSGEEFPMAYSGHPHDNPVDKFWTAGWTIPDDYPAGSLTYKIVATTPQGDTESWAPFNVKASQLAVVPGNAE
jgi:hypothetical protein